MGQKSSTLQFRVTQKERDNIMFLAKLSRRSPSDLLRAATKLLIAKKFGGDASAETTANLAAILSDVAKALGKPADTTPEELISSLQQIVNEIGSGPDVTDPTAAVAGLSRDELAAADAIVDIASRDRFLTLRRERLARRNGHK